MSICPSAPLVLGEAPEFSTHVNEIYGAFEWIGILGGARPPLTTRAGKKIESGEIVPRDDRSERDAR